MVRFVNQLFPFFHHLLFPRFALSSYPLQSNDKYTMNPNFSMDWLKKEINVEPITERRSLEIKKSYRCERIIVVQRSSTDSKSFFLRRTNLEKLFHASEWNKMKWSEVLKCAHQQKAWIEPFEEVKLDLQWSKHCEIRQVCVIQPWTQTDHL